MLLILDRALKGELDLLEREVLKTRLKNRVYNSGLDLEVYKVWVAKIDESAPITEEKV